MVNLLDFIKKLDNECVQISVLNKDRIEELTLELTFVSAFFHHYHSLLAEGCNEEIMSCISNEIHDLVQSRFRQSGEKMLVKLMDHEIPRLLENITYQDKASQIDLSMEEADAKDTQIDLLLQMFEQMKLLQERVITLTAEVTNVKVQKVVNFCFTLLDYCLDESEETDEDVYHFNSKLANLLVEIIPVDLEVMHICSKNLKNSKSAEFGRFIKKLLEASLDILREYLIHLQQHMVNAITPITSAQNTNVMIEFLLIILSDVPFDVNHHDKLFVLLAHVGVLIGEVLSDVLREDIFNLLDFLEMLNNEDQTVLDMDQIEKLKLELTFLSACLQLYYYISKDSNAEMSCISYEVYDLVQSLFHQREDGMLVKLNDHVVPRLLENIKSSFTVHHSESSGTMTED
ncbi:hypothetical protein CQW23_12711 [Capsicum baccatum]|uniref:Uncharacterized protein n=1 Tax=Capsicum baccatum TaxID=33114 RepID=A0A2G2WTE6_CAPBA|nr:hypothetical protein CQW23_12711 [Capsicum baccatum]